MMGLQLFLAGYGGLVFLVINIPKDVNLQIINDVLIDEKTCALCVDGALYMYPVVGCLREIFVVPTVCYMLRLNVFN